MARGISIKFRAPATPPPVIHHNMIFSIRGDANLDKTSSYFSIFESPIRFVQSIFEDLTETIPVAGTFDALYVELNSAPSTEAFALILYVNDSATAIDISIDTGETSWGPTIPSVHVSQGDRVYWVLHQIGDSLQFSIHLNFTPD